MCLATTTTTTTTKQKNNKKSHCSIWRAKRSSKLISSFQSHRGRETRKQSPAVGVANWLAEQNESSTADYSNQPRHQQLILQSDSPNETTSRQHLVIPIWVDKSTVNLQLVFRSDSTNLPLTYSWCSDLARQTRRNTNNRLFRSDLSDYVTATNGDPIWIAKQTESPTANYSIWLTKSTSRRPLVFRSDRNGQKQ